MFNMDYLKDLEEREVRGEEIDFRKKWSDVKLWEFYKEELMGPIVPYESILALNLSEVYDLIMLYAKYEALNNDFDFTKPRRPRGSLFSDYSWLLEVIIQVQWLYQKKEGSSEKFLDTLSTFDVNIEGISHVSKGRYKDIYDFLKPLEKVKVPNDFPYNSVRGLAYSVKRMCMDQLCEDMEEEGKKELMIKVLDIYSKFFEGGKIQYTVPRYPFYYKDDIEAYRKRIAETLAVPEQPENQLQSFEIFKQSLVVPMSGGSVDSVGDAARIFMALDSEEDLSSFGADVGVEELFTSNALNGTRQVALERLLKEGYVLGEGALEEHYAVSLRGKKDIPEGLESVQFGYDDSEQGRVNVFLRNGEWVSLSTLDALRAIHVLPEGNIKVLTGKGKKIYVSGSVANMLQREAKILRYEPTLPFQKVDEQVKKKIEVVKNLRAGQEKEVEEVLKPETILKSFEQQVSILKERGLLTERNDEYGIVAENGEWYPLPSIEDIQKKIETVKQDPTLREKVKQGFSELLVVPFGLSEKTMREALASSLQEHSESGTLKNILGETLHAHKKVQVEVPRDFDDEEEREEIFYYPKNLDMNAHGAMTKEEVIQMSKAGDFPGWKVLLVEDLPQVPSQYEGKIIADRLQIEGGKRPVDVLEMMKTIPTYQHEQGMTLEDWYMYALTNLDAKGYMIDDVMNDLGATKLLGVFRPASNGVLVAYWWNVRGKVEIYEIAPRTLHEQGGARNVLDLGAV